jgi:hypothetical protein
MIKYENKEAKFVGCVYGLGEHNYYNDSDFYALYLDIENGTLESEEYNTTRFADGGVADIDLSFDMLNEWWKKAKDVQAEAIRKTMLMNAEEVSKGKVVVVNRGRKVPHGIKGEVFWTRDVNYDAYGRECGKETKIGLKDDNNNVYWTYAKNVDVVSPENYVDENLIESKLKNTYDKFFDIAVDLRKDEDKESLKKEYYQF